MPIFEAIEVFFIYFRHQKLHGILEAVLASSEAAFVSLEPALASHPAALAFLEVKMASPEAALVSTTSQDRWPEILLDPPWGSYRAEIPQSIAG